MKICILFLTCANDKEADEISKVLLEKHLVVCIKKFPVSSTFLWKGKIDRGEEVFLIMDSIEENFDKVNSEVKKIHSYKTYVLFSTPVNKTTPSVEKWMNKELK